MAGPVIPYLPILQDHESGYCHVSVRHVEGIELSYSVSADSKALRSKRASLSRVLSPLTLDFFLIDQLILSIGETLTTPSFWNDSRIVSISSNMPADLDKIGFRRCSLRHR